MWRRPRTSPSTRTPQPKDSERGAVRGTLPAGQPVNYAMGAESSAVTPRCKEGFRVSVSGDAFVRDVPPPLPDIHLFTVGPFSLPNLFSLSPVTFMQIHLTPPAHNVDLGNLLPTSPPRRPSATGTRSR